MEVPELGLLSGRIRLAKEAALHPEGPGHDGGEFDPDMGLVCSCGEMIEGFPESAPRPQSETTLAARNAEPATPLVPPKGYVSAVEPEDPILAMIEVLDPTEVYTPAQVEAHILDAVARLERGAHFERLCIEDVYRLQLEWDLLEAAEMGAAHALRIPQDVRRKYAITQHPRLYERLNRAKMKSEAVKVTMHSLRSVISGYQSVAKSVAASYGAAGGQSK